MPKRGRGVRITPAQIEIYWEHRALGQTRLLSAQHAGFSPSTAASLERERRGIVLTEKQTIKKHVPDPLVPSKLGPEAHRSLRDFGYFQRRYFGRIAYPWQVEAAHRVVELLESPHKEFLVVNCPPGSGKPVSVDALVTMADGSRKRLGDVRVGDSVITHLGRHRSVTAVHEQGCLKSVRLQTVLGRSVVAADDHPFLTTAGFVNAADLIAGQRLPLVDFEPISGSYPSEAEMVLAGYFVGDGCTMQGNANFTNADPGVLADFESRAKEMGWEIRSAKRDPRGKATCVSVGGVGLHRYGPRAWLAEWGLRDKTSWHKRVPAQVFRAPNDRVAAFLGAYLACDGHVTRNGMTVEFYSVNRDLLVDVQSLLTRFGIASSLRRKNGRYNGEVHVSWRLSIRQRERFARFIPVAGEKGDALSRITQRRPFLFADAVDTVEDAGFIECRCLTVDNDHTFLVGDLPVSNSTLFSHDIPAWLTARNRQIRGMIGSATTNLAEGYVDRLRRSLARTLPVKNSDDDIKRGLALDAEATMAGDFGRFQVVGDTWTRSSFVVQQPTELGLIQEKEATWSGYGMDAGYIGQRFDFVIWDDLVDPKKQRTQEAREALELYWDDVSEPRLEPGGLLVLQGQRFAADDLYRYCLDKTVGEEMDWDTGEFLEKRPKYQHILFKAHYEEKCNPEVTHKRGAKAYPHGCLLSPERLPWRELSSHIANRGDRFEVVYQQQDGDPASVLVPKTWIYGGDGFPGCTDPDRDRLELPRNPDGSCALVGDLVSYMTVDPSPTRYWALEWWIYQPSVEYRWLMDLERRLMEANEFLDFNHATQRFTGLLEEWVQTSVDLGVPVTHVIVEANAAQRFLLQYNLVHQWMARRNVEIVAHNTHRNKSDPDLGVESIREHYKFGRKRLPYKRNSDGFNCSMNLINELTTYPHGRTDDCVKPGTMVTTPWGPVPVEDIKRGSLVLSHTGQWRRVERVGARLESDALYTVHAAGALVFEATGNHPVLVAQGERVGPTKVERFDLDHPEWVLSEKLRGSTRHSENPVAVLTPFDTTVHDPSSFDADDADWALLLGLYLAEGSCGDHNVAFGLAAHEGWIAEWIAEQFRRRYGCKAFQTVRGGSLQVSFNSVKAKADLQGFGSRANKALLPEALQWPVDLQRAVLRGWLIGDGSLSGRKLRGVSISRRLLHQMETFAWRLGAAPRLALHQEARTGEIAGRPFVSRDSWALHFGEQAAAKVIDQGHTLDQRRWGEQWFLSGRNLPQTVDSERGVVVRKLRRVTARPYEGLVHNLQVKEDESYLVEGVAVHNCVMADWFGEWNLPRIYSPMEAEGRSWRPSWANTVPGLRRTGGVESRAHAMMQGVLSR